MQTKVSQAESCHRAIPGAGKAKRKWRVRGEMQINTATTRVRPFNLGLHFLASKVALSCLSVDRFGKFFGGLMTLGQVKRVPNFC